MKYVRDFNPNSRKTGKLRGERRRFFSSRKILDWSIKILAVFLAFTAAAFLWYSQDLPDPNKLLTREVPQSTKLYSKDATLLYEIHGEFKRTLIPFSEMNNYIKQATIAIEDKSFYTENGINIKGIMRSVFKNILSRSARQGGSTITQQFVRNAILTREKTFSRKIKEIILSLEINERFSKDDILKLYLNEIPYGRNAYGIEAASQAYFGIHAKDLSLAQAAYLAALPQAPTFYNPFGPHRKSLDDRKNVVLNAMLAQGYINQQQFKAAKSETVKFLKNKDNLTAPHFVLYVQDYLSQKYGEKTLESGGLKIFTTLDMKLQKIAEKVVKDGAENNSKKYKAHNAALVAIDPKTGQILAMVGSKDYYGDSEPKGCAPGLNCSFEPDVNVSVAQRQPGSSGKPYVYATAFKPEFKQSPATLRLDVVTNFGTFGGKDYVPHNFTGIEYGPVSIRQALAGSLNVPAVKTLALVGVDKAIQTMRDFGITSPLKDCGLSLVLGGCEVRLLDHVSGFATFATMGTRHPITGILKIEDSKGRLLEEFKDDPTEVINQEVAYEVVDILTDNNARTFIFGVRSPLILPDRVVAAKTGTSQNFHDAWTLGFTPSLAAGVWVGNNDGSLLKKGADGVIVAAPIWHAFMEQSLKGTPVENFQAPPGIKRVVVDQLSGKLPNLYTPLTKTEIFADYAVPTDTDDVHVVACDSPKPQIQLTPQASRGSANGLLTTPPFFGSQNPTEQPKPQADTQGERRICPDGSSPKLYTVLHSEKQDNPNWENPVRAWANAHTDKGYSYPPDGSVPVNNNTPAPQNQQPEQIDPGQPPEARILHPSEGSVLRPGLFNLTASVVPDKNNTITRVDLLIDGTFIESKTSGPFVFTINQNFGTNTSHTFAIHAVDDKNNTTDDSVLIIFR